MGQLAIALLALSITTAAPKKKAPPPLPPVPTAPSEKLAEAMGTKPVAVLESATQFTVYRVNAAPGVRPAPELAVGQDFERAGAGAALTAEQLKKLRAIMYDEKSFKLDQAPKCNFVPDAAIIAQSGVEAVEVLLSFKCDALMFFATKPGGRSIPGSLLHFKPSRKDILALVKEALPNEAAIRGLK
jgi:hypothetical protein